MALLKCKMCGGSLEVSAGATIIECEYCGTQQTLPKTTDENIQNLFNRANLLRQKNEFDKAEVLYEKILEADDKEAEAYWGVILCKFGIEYVEDPKTYKRIPTCHRTSYDSIVADEYYKKALEYADATQRSIYESEAKQIDEIQKSILAIATQEEPYDVFICYKETDANGKRTQDSVIANDIYYQLKQEGFKVFYAAITLEGKLGSAYEPIIFAALNSAKVMLVVGSKPEYFNAVWVKNEWSRFLKMIKNDRSKLLIPCYKDMDAYELPEEFAHLQAQDMSKIGFINDIVRGIKKVIKKTEPKSTVVKETVVTNASANVAPLLERAFMFLEDGNWDSANEYCEKVLDLDPKNAQAYLGKFLVDTKTKKETSILNKFDESNQLKNNANFQKALRFANAELREKLNGYIKTIDERYEQNRIKGIYDKACNQMKSATYNSFMSAAKLFDSIIDYLDSKTLKEDCLEKAEICNKNDIYIDAIALMNTRTMASAQLAIESFKSIPGWKNADEQLAKCEALLPQLREKEEQERIARKEKAEAERLKREKEAEAERLRRKKEEEEKRIAKAKRKRQTKATIIVILAIIVVGLILWFFTPVGTYSFTPYEDGYSVSCNKKFIVNADIPSEYMGKPVVHIEENAFKGCKNLKTVTIPETIQRIGGGAFNDCTALEYVYFNATSMRGNVGSNGLSYSIFQDAGTAGKGITVVIGANVTTIPDSMFIGKNETYSSPAKITTIVFEEGSQCKSIGNSAFYRCPYLTSIRIPDSVTSIGYHAFGYCSSLSKIIIPNSVKEMGGCVFCNSSNVTVYCRAKSQPSAWSSDWNEDIASVVWGYKGN